MPHLPLVPDSAPLRGQATPGVLAPTPACFLVSVIGSRAALDLCVHALVCAPVFGSLGYEPRSGSAGPVGCTILRSCQHCTRFRGPHVRANTRSLAFRAQPSQQCEVASPWSCGPGWHFPHLSDLSTCSWPFVGLLRRTVSSSPLPILKLIIFSGLSCRCLFRCNP